ncbi:MAG: peptidoglycan DD-metalloendopeptidase family protein [Candidatus Woesebacteria bacterium]|nr:peptidoglycan DD-metalloendopeptidase family protein [Candidatus Woesebacteria bacterium]
MADISLRVPFNGDYPATFAFSATSDNEEIKKKFTEWGITGHNGIDYGLPEGTEVVAAADGKVIQAGDNGDFGISITIQHSWGQSLYAHLKETKVSQDQEVKAGDPIGLSGQTGAAFGEHLHFAIKPNDSNINNGYLGFVDPSPYFGKPEPARNASHSDAGGETKPPEVQPIEENPQSPVSPISPISPEPKVIIKEIIKEVPVEVVKEVIKEVIKEVQVVNQEEVEKQVTERLKTEQDERRKLANEARTQKKKDNLNKILEFVKEKKIVTNDDIRDFLRISQSTATNYLTELAKSGKLKREGEHGGTKYTA